MLLQANAEEFYEVYKGVVHEYSGMVGELTAGPCIAMEIRAKDAVPAFREMVGPSDPVSHRENAYKCVNLVLPHAFEYFVLTKSSYEDFEKCAILYVVTSISIQ